MASEWVGTSGNIMTTMPGSRAGVFSVRKRTEGMVGGG